MIVREICEHYTGISPLDVEQMTFDQIFLLICKKDSLKRYGTIKASPQSLAERGLISLPDGGMGGSYAKRLRAKRANQTDGEVRAAKRERRRQRREQLIRFKQQQEQQANQEPGDGV